ncbi:MAG: Gfo/Idh/MocA family oxidoreductase [Pirellulales bacterium]|nr:Gfo/Idh/MocA family oxidoreductase [Pirellulales bacterium]
MSTAPITPDSGAVPPRSTRRRFLLGAGAVGVAAAIGGAGYWTFRRRVKIGVVGCGVRGHYLASILRRTRMLPYYGQIVAVADVNLPQAEDLVARHRASEWPKPEIYQDYHRLLARDDVEAVIVSTPDHWHAAVTLAAIDAGKAVYTEKPLTHQIGEGQRVVAAVERSGAVLQCGLQQRSDYGFRTAAELARNGRLGPLKRLTVTCIEQGLEGGPFPAQSAPAGLDWDMWLGPAPLVDYCPERHQHWHDWREYGGGEITNWGVHHVDIAQWAIGAENSGPLEIAGQAEMPTIARGYNEPRTFSVELRYPGEVTLTIKSVPRIKGQDNTGLEIEGARGTISVTRSKYSGAAFDELATNPLPPEAVRMHAASTPHKGNIAFAHLYHFLKMVRAGATPISDVVSAHRSATACNVANLALELGRTLKWDPAREDFIDDPEASALRDRPRRAPYVI